MKMSQATAAMAVMGAPVFRRASQGLPSLTQVVGVAQELQASAAGLEVLAGAGRGVLKAA